MSSGSDFHIREALMRKLLILLAAVASALAIMMVGGVGTASACDPPNCPPKERGDDESGKDGKPGCKPKKPKCPGNGNGGGGKPKCPGNGNGGKPNCPGNGGGKPKCPGDGNGGGGCKPKCPPAKPPAGNCQDADLVLLTEDAKILCLFLGENAPLADKAKQCPDALIPLPVDELIGVCLFLPPADNGGAAASTRGGLLGLGLAGL